MGDSQRIQVPAFVTAFMLIFMVLRDLFVGQIDYGWYHILGKTFFFLACLGIGFYARYRVHGSAPKVMVAIIAVVFLNCAHSLSYEPAFHAGYNTTALLALFVYNKSMRGFLGILLFSYILLVVTLFASGVKPGPIYIDNWRESVLIDHLAISVIIWLIYHGIVKQMQERDFLYGQFIDVGRKTSMIVHDLKGGLASPLLYVDVARDRVSDPQVRNILKRLKDDLQFLNLYANELSQFTKRADHSAKEFFRISDVVRSLTNLATNEFSSIQIILEGNYEVYLNKDLFRRILMNALLNSAEAATESREGVIVRIRVRDERIIIEDNGPGFSPEVLKKITRGESVTTKKNGSGLGCRIISDYAKLMGGKVSFSNSPARGALVEIYFRGGRFIQLTDQEVEVADALF